MFSLGSRCSTIGLHPHEYPHEYPHESASILSRSRLIATAVKHNAGQVARSAVAGQQCHPTTDQQVSGVWHLAERWKKFYKHGALNTCPLGSDCALSGLVGVLIRFPGLRPGLSKIALSGKKVTAGTALPLVPAYISTKLTCLRYVLVMFFPPLSLTVGSGAGSFAQALRGMGSCPSRRRRRPGSRSAPRAGRGTALRISGS